MQHVLRCTARSMAAGVLLRRDGRTPENAHTVINAVIMHVSLPAVTQHYLHSVHFDAGDVWPVLMPWALFVIGAAVFHVLGRVLRLPAASVGALTLVGGFGNTSFAGLPMIESLHGVDGLGPGVLIDQFGSYLALSTLGIATAALYSAQGPVSSRVMAVRVATFPLLVALVVALLLLPVPFHPVVEGILARIGDTLAPLAMLSVGLQLRFGAMREYRQLLCIGLGFKPLSCPALVIGLRWAFGASPGMANSVGVIEAAMPPMIGAGVVNAQMNLAPRLVSTMTGRGIPLGLATAPAWFWLLGVLAA